MSNEVVQIELSAFNLLLEKIKIVSCKNCQCELTPSLPVAKVMSYTTSQSPKTLNLKINITPSPRELYLLDMNGITLPIGIGATVTNIIFADNTTHKFTGPFNNSFTSAEFRELVTKGNGQTTLLYDKIGDKVAYWPVPLSYKCKEVK